MGTRWEVEERAVGDGHPQQIDQCRLHDGLHEIHTAHTDGAAGRQPDAGDRQRSQGRKRSWKRGVAEQTGKDVGSEWRLHRWKNRVRKTSANFMQPSAAHGTAFRRSPALCKASGFMTGTAQSRKAVKVEIVDRIVQTAQNSINPTISFLVAQ